MTILEVMAEMDLSPMLRAMIRGVLAARCPGLVEKQLGIIIDREAEVVTLQADGEAFIIQAFGEIESLINGDEEGAPIA